MNIIFGIIIGSIVGSIIGYFLAAWQVKRENLKRREEYGNRKLRNNNTKSFTY